MTAIRDSIVPTENVSVLSAVGLIFTEDGRYLMQLRDDNPGILFPNYFCLFGGTVEKSEGPVKGLRRELREELELEADRISYFSQLAFDAVFTDGTTHQRYYFEVPVSISVVDSLTFHEGAEMRLMTADDIAREALRFVPYDFGILRMHMLLRQNDGETSGAKNGPPVNMS